MTEPRNPAAAIDGLHALALAKAEQDAAFKAELLANPRAAIEKLVGTEIPPHITLKAVEQPADTYVIVVPTGVTAGVDGELTDGDLEAVAGGSKAGARTFFKSMGSGVIVAGAIFEVSAQKSGEAMRSKLNDYHNTCNSAVGEKVAPGVK